MILLTDSRQVVAGQSVASSQFSSTPPAAAQFKNTGTGTAATDPFWSVIYQPVAPFTSAAFADVLGRAYVPSAIPSRPWQPNSRPSYA